MADSGEGATDMARLNSITRKIIGAAVRVHRELAPGLLESAYCACLAYELLAEGLELESQVALPVVYRGVKLDCGYRLQMVVEDAVIVETKAVDKLIPIHKAQVLSYLRLSRLKAGLLINFSTRYVTDGIVRLLLGHTDGHTDESQAD